MTFRTTEIEGRSYQNPVNPQVIETPLNLLTDTPTKYIKTDLIGGLILEIESTKFKLEIYDIVFQCGKSLSGSVDPVFIPCWANVARGWPALNNN